MANTLDVPVGLLVTLNFAYELRSLSNLGHPNITGGKLPPGEFVPGGACTSIVAGTKKKQTSKITNAEQNDGTLWHGRNLDWNLPDAMRNLTFVGKERFDIFLTRLAEWTKGGKVLFKSVQYVGYVGVLTGVRSHSFGLSINERLLGGSVSNNQLVKN